MLRTTTVMTLLAAASMLSACGRDAVNTTPDDVEAPPADAPIEPEAVLEPEAATESDPPPFGACGTAPAAQFEVLDAPAADTHTDIRVRWPSTAPMPHWECCPYQHLPGPFVQGGRLIEYQEGTDAEGRFVDLQIAVDDTPGAELTAGLSFCAAHVQETWTIAPSPFADTAAALLACEPVEDGVSFRDHEAADLRITQFNIDGKIEPGATIELQVGLTEVSGLGHGYYPGLIFAFDPPVVELNETVGLLYAIFACQEVPFTLPVTLPADLDPGTTLTITAQAGEPLCPEGDCRIDDAMSVTRRVQTAP